MRPYIAAARLFFELLDAMTPISVDLPEQRHFPVERQVGDRDQMRRFGTGPADVQGTHDSAFFAHVEDARHIASRRNGRTGTPLGQCPDQRCGQPGFERKEHFQRLDQADGLVVDHPATSRPATGAHPSALPGIGAIV